MASYNVVLTYFAHVHCVSQCQLVPKSFWKKKLKYRFNISLPIVYSKGQLSIAFKSVLTCFVNAYSVSQCVSRSLGAFEKRSSS